MAAHLSVQFQLWSGQKRKTLMAIQIPTLLTHPTQI
jgi:hypothetical protein